MAQEAGLGLQHGCAPVRVKTWIYELAALQPECQSARGAAMGRATRVGGLLGFGWGTVPVASGSTTLSAVGGKQAAVATREKRASNYFTEGTQGRSCHKLGAWAEWPAVGPVGGRGLHASTNWRPPRGLRFSWTFATRKQTERGGQAAGLYAGSRRAAGQLSGPVRKFAPCARWQGAQRGGCV